MEKRLKIALVDDSFYPIVDGVANVVCNYATLLSINHDVTVFTTMPPIPIGEEHYPFKVVRCKMNPNFGWGDYKAATPLLDKDFRKQIDQQFDIIHIHSPMVLGHLAMMIAKKRRIPLIGTLHTQFHRDMGERIKSKKLVSFMIRTYITPCFNACYELWTMNKGVEELARSYGYKGKTYIISNASDFKEIKYSFEEIETLKKEYAPNNEKILLFVGRLSLVKNLEFIINVAKQLKDQGFAYKLLLVGRGSDENYLKELVKKLDIENEVIFTGELTDRSKLQLYYRISDLLIFPSFYDVESLTKIEGAAVGLPTIFAKGSLTSYSVEPDFNGYVEVAEKEPFANKIISVLTNLEKYHEVRKNVRDTVYKTWNQIVEKAEQRYFEVIEEYKSKRSKKVKKEAKTPIENIDK